MERTEIETKITVSPWFFDGNLNSHLLGLLKEKLENTCTQEHGYILRIHRIISHTNLITCTGTIFTVKFEAETIKPVSGKIYTGNITMIFQYGFFVEIKGKLKVLVPKTQTGGYTYENGMFVKGKQKLLVGNEVKIQITGVSYESHKFSCIGKLQK